MDSPILIELFIVLHRNVYPPVLYLGKVTIDLGIFGTEVVRDGFLLLEDIATDFLEDIHR